jgi:glycosyltransferase involved in cell wall biosynthesis
MVTKNSQIAVAILNLIQYESICAGLNEFEKYNIPFDIYVPKIIDDSAGFREMYEDTYSVISQHSKYNIFRTPRVDYKYKIVLAPYNLEGILHLDCDYRVRYQYGFATKPYWGLRYETNKSFDNILCYGPYDESFYKSYADANVVGFLKYADFQIKSKHKHNDIKKKILYLPTYGSDSSIDAVSDKLSEIKNDFEISVKIHHGTSYLNSEAGHLKKIRDLFTNVYTSKDNLQQLIEDTDLVISDRSAAIFDSIYLEKPVIVHSNKVDYFYNIPSLLDQCIEENKIISIRNINNIIEQIQLGFTSDYLLMQTELKRNLFPIQGNKSLIAFLEVINNLLHGIQISNSSATSKDLKRYIIDQENIISNNNEQYDINEVKKKDALISQQDRIIWEKQAHLDKIYNGRIWKLLSLYFNFRDLFKNFVKGDLFNSSIFNDINLLKPIEINTKSVNDFDEKIKPFTIIVTVFNEESSISTLLESLLNQSASPKKIIVVDAGSKDRTVEKINEICKKYPNLIRLIIHPGSNISKGRNIALKNCADNIVVSVDAGCSISDNNYLYKLVYPFNEPNTDLVAGITKPQNKNRYSDLFLPQDWQKVNYHSYLPSARCVAYKKSIAKKIGFYDESLQTGEDTLFDVLYRRFSKKWTIVSNAVIYWNGPNTREDAKRLLYRYSYGDGLSGFGNFKFHSLNTYKNLDSYSQAQLTGYLDGLNNKLRIILSNKKQVEMHYVTNSEILQRLTAQKKTGVFKIVFLKDNSNFWNQADQTYFSFDFENSIYFSHKLTQNTKLLYKTLNRELIKNAKFYVDQNNVNARDFFQQIKNDTIKHQTFFLKEKYKNFISKLSYELIKKILVIFDIFILIFYLRFNKNKKYIILPLVDWNIPLKQRYQHMPEALASKKNTVIYCTPCYNERFVKTTKIKNNLFVTPNFHLVKAIAKNVTFITYAGDKKTTWQNINQLKSKGNVLYEYVDDISSDIIGDIPDSMLERHGRILRDEDIYISTSASNLFQEVSDLRKKNHSLVTNGVDLNHFTYKTKSKIPEEIRNKIKNKIVIGYFGAFASWFDYNLISELSQILPDKYILLLLGWDYDGTLKESKIHMNKNIIIAGPIDYDELPSYAKHFDYSILPFKINEVTKSTSPIKLFEYMSLGKPIITTPLPECKKYQSVLLASSAEEFLQHVIHKEYPSDYYSKMRLEAINNSWESKADQIERLVQ